MALMPDENAPVQAQNTPQTVQDVLEQPPALPAPADGLQPAEQVIVNGKPIKTANQLYAFMQAIDPDRAGVGLDKIRPLYPKTGWDKILAVVKILEDSGRVTKRAVINARGGAGYEIYTWQEV